MDPRWPARRSSEDTIKATARIREALEWIAHNLTRSENIDTWLTLGEIEPERTRIEFVRLRLVDLLPPARTSGVELEVAPSACTGRQIVHTF